MEEEKERKIIPPIEIINLATMKFPSARKKKEQIEISNAKKERIDKTQYM